MKKLPFGTAGRTGLLFGLLLAGRPGSLLAQATTPAEGPMLTQPAVLGMLALLLIIVIGAVIVLVSRVGSLVQRNQPLSTENAAGRFDETVTNLSPAQLAAIVGRQQAQGFGLQGDELGSATLARDPQGLVRHVEMDVHSPWLHEKRHTARLPDLNPKLVQLVSAYLLCAAFWLVLGTTVGWYAGI